MVRTLRYVGLAALAAAAWMLLAVEAGWLERELADALFIPVAAGGAICLVTSLVSGMLSPVGRALKRSRCARCGVVIEKGQTYCRDHLRETVNEYRDQIHRGQTRGKRERA